MAENPATKPAEEPFAPVLDLPSAPIIFFEACPTLGNNNGIINVMLATGLVLPAPNNQIASVAVAVAHLRCTVAAAMILRDTLDKALLIGAPVENPQGKAN